MASVSTIGTTYLGKPMKVITMSTKPGSKRPTLFYDGGLHARCDMTPHMVSFDV
jgi:hypothetical protein